MSVPASPSVGFLHDEPSQQPSHSSQDSCRFLKNSSGTAEGLDAPIDVKRRFVGFVDLARPGIAGRIRGWRLSHVRCGKWL